MTPTQTRSRNALGFDLMLALFLIGFDVVVRLLPHVPGVWPFAASALFAGRVLRNPVLAVVVPVAAIVLTNTALAGDDWRITLFVCAATVLPAFAGMATRNYRGLIAVPVSMIACSLAFFVITNFAVWAFGTMYSHDWQGLVQCYVAALPFLDKTVLGDLFWTAVLFGGAALVQMAPRLARRSI